MKTKRRVGRKPVHSSEEILRTACTLFAQKGYHNTTMNEIAKAAGLTKGGIYHYLESKEDVLYLLHDGLIKEGLRRLGRIVQEDRPPYDKLVALIEAHIWLMHDYYEELRIFFQEMLTLTGEKFAEVRRMRAEYEQYFVGVIEAGAAAGVIRTSEPLITARFILGAVNWMFTWYSPTGRLSPDDLKEILIQMIMDGLRQPAGYEMKKVEVDGSMG